MKKRRKKEEEKEGILKFSKKMYEEYLILFIHFYLNFLLKKLKLLYFFNPNLSE